MQIASLKHSYFSVECLFHIASIILSVLIVGDLVEGQTDGACKPGMRGKNIRKPSNFKKSILGAGVACKNGFANEFPCHNIDLQSFVSLSDLDTEESTVANDIWGWTKDGREFALIGLFTGTSFVEVTDPINPVVLGKLPTKTENSRWRDIKTFQDYAFIVSEASDHGMQVFDLNQLLTTTSYTIFSETIHYPSFGQAHNIFINEESGFAYVVGIKEGEITCNSGLHMVDIKSPLSPVFAGCYSNRGYTHDVQCVIYDGPDTSHTGKEICFASNEDTVDIIDVSNKNAPIFISEFYYSGARYVHQGWLTEDNRYFLIDDELDEVLGFGKTKTIIADFGKLTEPILAGVYTGPSQAVDHNQYIVGNFTFQANYRAGLSILEIVDAENGNLRKFGSFDTFIENDKRGSNGAWSNFPFFESGNVIVSDIEQGLFVLYPNMTGDPPPPHEISSPLFTVNSLPLPQPIIEIFDRLLTKWLVKIYRSVKKLFAFIVENLIP